MLFHKVDDAQVVLRSKGVWSQREVYRRGDDLYAKYGSGFIGLRRYNGTTVPHISWDHIEGVAYTDKAGALGRLTVTPEVKARAA